eukprot:277672_1
MSNMSIYWLIYLPLMQIVLISSQIFEIGSYILTQNALDDAPTRYATWITYALNELNNQTLQDYSDSTNNCWFGDYYYTLDLSRADYNFTLDKSSIQLFITSNGFHTGAILDFNIATPVYSGGYVGGWFVCWHETNCNNDIIYATATITTNANVSIIWDPNTLKATVDPHVSVYVSDPNYDISNCGGIAVHFINWYSGKLKTWVQNTINTAIQSKIDSMTQEYLLPQTFSPYEGVNVSYNITDLQFAEHEYVKASAHGILKARNTNDDPDKDHTTWYTYLDESYVDSMIAPPTYWPQSPFYKSYNNVTTGLYLLNGLRLSSTLFSALMWAADTSGQLNPNYTYTVLDATLIFRFEWNVPIMKIPKNGTLLLELTYGTVNGTCYETEGDPSDQHSIIEFEVFNVTANGSIGLNSKDVLNIEIDQFYLDNVNLSLQAPPIPLPENVINAILKEMLNATVPYLNDWLTAHAFSMPEDIADYLPNPNLSIIHQDEYNYTDHGYAELLSICACAEDSLFTSCNGLQCVFPTITPNPTSDPTISPTISPTIEPSVNPSSSPTIFVNYTFSPTIIPNSNYSVWMYLLDGPTMQLNSKDNLCVTENVGDEQIIVKLTNTAGFCEPLNGALIFQGMVNRNYYSLQMDINNNDIISISLFCDDSCSSCSYSSSNVEFGECYNNITVLHNQYNVMFMIYNYKAISNNTEIINNKTAVINNYNNNICYGGNSKMISNNSMIWITYQYSSTCNSYSVLLQNFGTFNSCTIQNGGRYNKLSSYMNVAGNQTFYTFITGCDSSCNQSLCTQTQPLQYNQCLSYYNNTSSKFIFSSELSVCGKEVPYNIINGTTPAPTHAIDILSTPKGKTILIVIITMSCCVLILIGFSIWKRRQIKLICQNDALPFIKDVLENIKSSFDCSVGKISQQEILETFAMSLCGAMLIWQSDSWRSSSPWAVFTIEAFEKLGVQMTYLNVEKLNNLLDNWTDFGATVNILFASFCFALVALRLILIKPASTSIWTALRVFVLFGYLIMHFFIFVGPSMQYDFKDVISIDRSNISNTTLQASSEMIDKVDIMMGYAFVGVFISYLSNLMLFWLSCIPVACYIMCVIFIIRQFNDDNNNQFGFISYNIELQDKIQLFTRLQVCLCMFQGLSAIIQALPVIILYQSFGVDVGWIVLWCMWWSFPLFLLFRLTMILRTYIFQLKHPNTYYRIRPSSVRTKIVAKNDENVISNVEYKHPITLKSLRIQLWINISAYFIAFIVTFLIAIKIEKGYATNMDFTFIESNITTTFIITLVLTFCGLNELFLLHQKIVPTSDANNDTTEMMEYDSIANLDNLSGFQHYEHKSENNDNENDAAQLLIQNENQIKNEPIKPKNTQWCHQGKSFVDWLFESKERSNPIIYGERVLYRRFFLVIGTIGFGYSIIHQLYQILSITVKEEVINFLSDMNLDVTWPDSQHGGTIFDDAFELYNDARKIELGFATASFVCFFIACLFDICGRNKQGLTYSRYCCWISILLLFVSIISTALPNYLRDTDITAITPFCATNFNDAIDLISGDIVGILCSALFTVTLLPVLISVPPSLVRATFMVLHESQIFKLNQNQIDSLVSVIIVGSFLTPLITFFPLLVFQQLMGDNVTAVLIIIGWIAPIFVSFMFKHKKYGIKCSLYLYLLWLYIMLGSLVAIMIYEFVVYGVPKFFVQMIQELDFYTAFISEIFLSNVVISDFIYANIMALNDI